MSEIAACDRLESRHPNAQIWLVRIGSRYVRRFGKTTQSQHSLTTVWSKN